MVDSPLARSNAPAGAPEPLLKMDELAARLGMCRGNVQLLTRKRLIPCFRFGRRCVRYDLAQVREALSRFAVPVQASPASAEGAAS